jgi:hypothetical protein
MRSGNSKTGPRSQAARGCGSKIYQQYWRGGKLYLDMVSEHVIARLKDEFPGPSLRIRDGAKIMEHLPSGILPLTIGQRPRPRRYFPLLPRPPSRSGTHSWPKRF